MNHKLLNSCHIFGEKPARHTHTNQRSSKLSSQAIVTEQTRKEIVEDGSGTYGLQKSNNQTKYKPSFLKVSKNDMNNLESSNIGKDKSQKQKEKSSVINSEIRSRLEVGHYLLDVVEIEYIRLIAMSSTDKYVRIWDMNDINKPRVVFSLHMPKGGVHQVKFSSTYHVLLIAGYENSIPVFSITPEFYDVNVIGRLVGHVSIITAMELIEGTPMVITADDTGCIKTWDIRLCSCFQTLDLNNKTSISQLVSLHNLNRVAFIGCRINFLVFDKFDRVEQQENKNLTPLKAEINLAQEELIVCTNSDIRFIDIYTGRLKKIYVHLVEKDQADEISVFRIMPKSRSFLLADPKGDIYQFDCANGELLNQLQSHSQEVTGLKVDYYNKLTISSGADSSIIIQREIADGFSGPAKSIVHQNEDSLGVGKKLNTEDAKRKLNEINKSISMKREAIEQSEKTSDQQLSSHNKYEVLRLIKNTHGCQEILHLAVSVYHNFIASSSYDSCVYIYDYEYGKFFTAIKFPSDVQVTALEFINGLGILLVCTNDNFCCLVGVASKESKADFVPLAYIDLSVRSTSETLNKVLSSSQIPAPLASMKDIYSQPITTNPSLKNIQNITKPAPCFGEHLYVSLSLKGENKVLEDFKKTLPTETENIQLNECDVYFTLSNGFMSIYSLTSYFRDKKILKHSNTRQNYNPTRTNLEDCASISPDVRGHIDLGPDQMNTLKCLNSTLKKSFMIHKDGATSLTLINVPDEYLLTTGRDKYVKIISKSGECLCAWNVNHPLPLKWSIRIDTLQDMKNKILFSLKVIQAIFKRYYNMLYIEGKIFDLKGFIKQYKELDEPEQLETIFKLTQLSP